MQPANKLPLLRRAFKLLVEQLEERDRVAIVVYAGASGLVLPSTPCSEKERIQQAIERLEAGGSTNGGAGITLAYKTVEENFVEDGINRVILATDGDFNVGTTNQGDLTRLIEQKAKSGVFLTVLGFGMGNFKDSTLENLADRGNGNYAYIDTIQEAKRVLVESIGGTLVTIAKDVKIQVEFNPGEIAAYRLIGYENRLLRNQDFNDDRIDAGEIGAGHTVTALYELIPAGQTIEGADVDPLKYQVERDLSSAAKSAELLTLKLRYKEPAGSQSKLLEFPVQKTGKAFEQAEPSLRFASAVAAFGMLLRDSDHKGDSTYDKVISIAQGSSGEDRGGYRSEFVRLVKRAKALHDLENLEP
jgi:Ca-activated chloride channel family protein